MGVSIGLQIQAVFLKNVMCAVLLRIMHCEPDRFPVRGRPVDTVFSMSGQVEVVTLMQVDRCLVIEAQSCFAPQHDHPFACLRIVPAGCGRCVTPRDDSLDGYLPAAGQAFAYFFVRVARNFRENVVWLHGRVNPAVQIVAAGVAATAWWCCTFLA